MEEENTGLDTAEAGQEEVGETQEEQEAPVEAVAEPQPEEPKKKERYVPLKALEAERKKRQDYERKLSSLEKEAEEWRSYILSQQQKPKEEPDYDDSQIITAGDVKRILNEQLQTQRKSEREKQITVQFQEAKTKIEDFDEVWDIADQLAREKPWLKDVFLGEYNPVMAAYEYAKNHPAYASKRDAEQTGDIIEKVNKNLSKQGTLSEISNRKGIRVDEAQAVKNMKPEEFEVFWQNLKRGNIKNVS